MWSKNNLLKIDHKMKLTQIFRNQLGLSQEMMAIHLAIAKSQLSMYELGKRELPNATLDKLAELAVFFDQNKGMEAQPLEVQNDQEQKLNEFILFQIEDLKYKKIKEQRLLDAMQKKYNQNGVLYKWAQHLQETNTALAAVLMQQAIKGMEQNGLFSQTKQQLKLEIITSQLDYYQSLKEKQTKT